MSDRLSAIVRRLAGASTLPTSPQRRATDRLPARPADPRGNAAALGKEDLQALEHLRARRRVVGFTCAGLGAFAGLLVALVVGARSHDEVAYVSVPVTRVVREPAPKPAPFLPVPHEFAAPAASASSVASAETHPAEPSKPTEGAKAEKTSEDAKSDTAPKSPEGVKAETAPKVPEAAKVELASKPKEASLPDDESRLAVAVARGLGVGAKAVSEH